MTNINVFDDRTTQDLLTLVRMLRAGMFGASMMTGRNQIDTTADPIYFTNDSGEAIPPYACMQVTGTEEIGNQNYLVVDKPADTDGTAGGYLFNGPRTIAIDSEGIAQVEQVVRAFKDAGTVTGGEKWTPVVNQWYIAQDDDGPFICCGEDDIDTDVLKVFSQGVGGGTGSECRVFLTPGGGIAARSGSTLGSATCTHYTVTSGTRATASATATVYNDFTSAIGGSVDIIAAKIDGIWVAIAEDCPA